MEKKKINITCRKSYAPLLVIDIIELDPIFVSVNVGNWWQIHNPPLNTGGSCSVFHFVKEQICQEKMTW